MKKVCIATLTSRDRLNYLKVTITTFVKRTKLNEVIDWHILSNGSADNVVDYLKELGETQPYPNINFIIHLNEENTGVGKGINLLNSKVHGNYEYVYFLEDDWITLPHELSGKDNEWLNASIQLLDENPEINQILLRRYSSEMEMRQYAYQSIITGINFFNQHKEIGRYKFSRTMNTYTNNPHIRRDKSFYDIGVLPLPEFDGEVKENPGVWGAAEIRAEEKVKEIEFPTWTMILPPINHHEHVEHRVVDKDTGELYLRPENVPGCGLFKEREDQVYSCKYGFMYHSTRWCGNCIKNENINYLVNHEKRFLENLNKSWRMYEAKDLDEKEGWDFIEERMKIAGEPLLPDWKEWIKKDYNK